MSNGPIKLTHQLVAALSIPKDDDPIRHHYVPVCLLRGFVKDGTNEISVLWKDGRTFPNSPEGIGFKKCLYSIKDDKSDKLSAVIEKLNSILFEGPAGALLESIRDGKGVKFKERPTIAKLVAFQLVRTPFYRANMLQAYDGMTERGLVDYITEHYKGKPDTFKGREFEEKPLDEHGKQFLFTTKSYDEVAKKWEALAKRKWRLLVAPSSAYFITSSMGLGLDSADGSHTVSFDDENCIIYFPIGSGVCLEISHSFKRECDLDVEYVELSSMQTVVVNRQVAFLADLSLVSRNPNHMAALDAFSANMTITREDQKEKPKAKKS